jgi:hypothetical protein
MFVILPYRLRAAALRALHSALAERLVKRGSGAHYLKRVLLDT